MTAPTALEWLRGEFPAAKITARKVATVMEAPGCVRRSVLDGAGVDTAALSKLLDLKKDRQSPFAVARTAQFQSALEKNSRADILALAREHLHLELSEVREKDLSAPATRIALGSAGERLRALQTTAAVKLILTGDPAAANLLLKPITALTMGSMTAWLEPDVLAFAEAGFLHVVTIRTFDMMDGKADPGQGGAERA